jgi:hypothetical protein
MDARSGIKHRSPFLAISRLPAAPILPKRRRSQLKMAAVALRAVEPGLFASGRISIGPPG